MWPRGRQTTAPGKDGFDILKDCRQKGRYRLYVVCTANIYICLYRKGLLTLCNPTGEGSAVFKKVKLLYFKFYMNPSAICFSFNIVVLSLIHVKEWGSDSFSLQ